MKGYTHLSKEERKKIFVLKQSGLHVSQIALKIGRSRVTIWREIKRNSDTDGLYLPDTADSSYHVRRKKPDRRKIIEGSSLYHYIADRIKRGWSPEQISGRMKIRNKPFYCCHETIYAYIYRKGNGNKWYQYLHKGSV